MDVPITSIRAAVEATRAEWTKNLDRLFERSHFILGEQLASFETEFAGAMQAGNSVGVANGTDAIGICIRDAQITGTVLTSALTAPFSGVAILSAGAIPLFADIDPETLQMDPADAANRLRKNSQGILAVHLYGQTCDLAGFSKLAKSRKLTLIQDACQAHGAHYRGQPLTRYSRYVNYSFYPTKNLGALGDGGAIATDHAPTHKRLTMRRDGGRNQGEQVSRIPGINSRLDEMQCCYLRAFLQKLPEWNADRARTASIYDEGLRDCPGIRLPKRNNDGVYHLYVARADRRDRLRTFLADRSIGTAIHYPVPLHLNPAFSGCKQKRGDLPHAERACKELISLPLWPYLKASDAERVVEGVRAFYRT